MIAIDTPCLGEGNTKVGLVPTFSLPARYTCPGATNWCLKHCYAWRLEVLRPAIRRAYARNLMLSWDAERFVYVMRRTLPAAVPLVRIHVGGDFFHRTYVEAWIRLCKAMRRTKFWAYTRSWSVQSLRPFLEELRELPNVHLFASVDPEMSSPPAEWRIAWVKTDSRALGLHCRHQEGIASSCLDCGYCFSNKQGDVIFKVH